MSKLKPGQMSSAAMKAPTAMPMMPQTTVITVNCRTTVSLYVSTLFIFGPTRLVGIRRGFQGTQELGIDVACVRAARQHLAGFAEQYKHALVIYGVIVQHAIAHSQRSSQLPSAFS